MTSFCVKFLEEKFISKLKLEISLSAKIIEIALNK